MKHCRRVLPSFIIGSLALTIASGAAGEGIVAQDAGFLNMMNIEEALTTIANRPRLVEDEWLNIVGDRKEGTYKVQRGDTLWSISTKEFGDPKLWRKLWQVNKYLSNPHDLEVGQILKYYMEGDKMVDGPNTLPDNAETTPELRIPFVKLLPERASGGFDLDLDSVYQKNLNNQFRPPILILTDKELLGEISGAYSERDGLNEHDEVWLNIWVPETMRIGDRYAIARFERPIRDTTVFARPIIGNLLRRIGELKIVGFGEKLVRAEIVNLAGIVRRGDSIVAMPKVVPIGQLFNPPPELTARLIGGDNEDARSYNQGEFVVVNRGKSDGLKDGYFFRVYRELDPKVNRADGVEPTFKGEVQIVYTGDAASVGLVLRNKDPLVSGENLIPAQSFLNVIPPKLRQTQLIELDDN